MKKLLISSMLALSSFCVIANDGWFAISPHSIRYHVNKFIDADLITTAHSKKTFFLTLLVKSTTCQQMGLTSMKKASLQYISINDTMLLWGKTCRDSSYNSMQFVDIFYMPDAVTQNILINLLKGTKPIKIGMGDIEFYMQTKGFNKAYALLKDK